jgi:prepilin-type N-terminal cleavage/methylation domain-containing protein/prepilin-type processing-associated H-X9-DG protein
MKRGFTLIELLVVVTIIAILAGLAVPGINSALARAKNAQSISNLRQIGIGLLGYASDHDNNLPQTGGTYTYDPNNTTNTNIGWSQQIEDYIGKYYKSSDGTTYINKILQNPKKTTLICGYYMGSHIGKYSGDPLASGQQHQLVNLARIQKPSVTILGGECLYWSSSPQDTDPDDYTQAPSFMGASYSSPNTKGDKTPVLFADGHVEMLDHYDPLNYSVSYDGPGNTQANGQ